MITDCANDIRNYKQISFLPNTLVHQKDKVIQNKHIRGGKLEDYKVYG